MKDTSVKRINLRLPAYVQDYYKVLGEKYSVPYSNYISMVLIQLYEREMEKSMLVELNSSLSVMKDALGDNPSSMIAESKNMLADIKSLSSKLGDD